MSLVEDFADRLPFDSSLAVPTILRESTGSPSSPVRTEHSFSIPASGPNGFHILVWSDAIGVRACFGGLEQEFGSLASARKWIERAMTQDCSLQIDFAGKRPYRWTLTYTNPDGSGTDQLISGQGTFTGMFAKKWSATRRNIFSDYSTKQKTIPIHLLSR